MKFADLLESSTEKSKELRTQLTGIKKPENRKRVIASAILLVFLGGLFGYQAFGKQETNSETEQEYTTAEVVRQDISQSLTASGTLEAANAYSVTSLVEGEVITALFEEGDVVEKDSILYELDSSDMSNNLEKAQITINQNQRNYSNALEDKADLTITACERGFVYSLDVEIGDDITAGQPLANIKDSSIMELTVPFPSNDTEFFYLGQRASVTLDGSFETLDATISEISGVDTILIGNQMIRMVTVEVMNPGAISTNQTATVTVIDVGSSDSGTFTYRAEEVIQAEVSGTVSEILVSEGDFVTEGQPLLVLSSDSIDEKVISAQESLRNAQLSYENTNDQLENYLITSPISGTIIDKNYEVGETTESNKVLATIYDLSYLTLTLNVDELDIFDVSVGQTVNITADAIEGRSFVGRVTKVSVAGDASNGATTYPVTIQIDESNGLLPGMNVDASILVSEASDVLIIPSAALMRGNRVLITKDSPSAKSAMESVEAPNGYVYVSVTTGVSNDDTIEITSGLTEGDVVAYTKAVASVQEQEMRMGMMGGMAGGNRPPGNPGAGGGKPQ